VTISSSHSFIFLISAFQKEGWKVATVVPIHKGGDKSCPGNYHPISLLSSMSKILENIVNNQLINFLESEHLLSPRQFGFRKNRSTEQAATLLVDLVSSYLDRGEACVGIFLDLARAFDTVSIPILLKKLELLGIRGIAWDWFKSYLANRRQCVRFGALISDPVPISFGEPQGSILGPTLFLIYLNDMISLPIRQAEIICYADTVLLCRDVSWEQCFAAAESGLSVIGKWLADNLLSLNIYKTSYICFHKTASSAPSSRPDLKLVCNSSGCDMVGNCTTVKYLGITLDEKLNFKKHIEVVSER
jgi:hypothetical protein